MFGKDRCLVCGRSNVRKHYFPKNPERVCVWLKNINRPDLLELFELNADVLCKKRLCTNHFADWCYSSTERKDLIRFAEPCKPCPNGTLYQFDLSSVGEICGAPDSSPSGEDFELPNIFTSSNESCSDSSQKMKPKTKIKILKWTISKLERANYKINIKTSSLLRNSKERVTDDQYKFILSKVQSLEGSKNGMNWTEKEKATAFKTFLQSAKKYNLPIDLMPVCLMRHLMNLK